ncbi:MAG: PLP-dependent aminotransferase family protein [Eubacteriales bacterium]|nr:PLP-dependent aminotransferase family protein [Eubacteriales bacterium]MDD4422977.1 PLP-dependent aminotransferase family protein [Eubacteriales bacterium]
MNYNFSDKVKDMRPSAIREIFKSLTDPSVIAFAAGNPSELSFPVEKMKNIAEEIFLNRSTEALQYSITEGYPSLRKQITSRLKERFSIGIENDSVIVTTGGQQGIDLTAKVLCNEGDTIICENPSFIGALNAFRSYNTRLAGVDMEDDGINITMLENALKTHKNVKMIYVIPTFHNPSGITTSLEKRKAILELAKKYDVVILEDNPYGELRFSGEEIPTIKSLDTDGRVVYCSSFSKILSAGMRVGFLCGPNSIIQKVVVAKQVNDVHTNIFFQMLVSSFIDIYGLDEHISSIRGLYRKKSSLMLSRMDEKFDKKIKYTRPEGGLFLWVTVPGCDADEIAKTALGYKVAVVPGSTFSPEQGKKSSSFRLNYSYPSDRQITDGIDRLAPIINNI